MIYYEFILFLKWLQRCDLYKEIIDEVGRGLRRDQIKITERILKSWMERFSSPKKTKRERTIHRMSGQLMPLKNGWDFKSFAPLSEPNLFLGSLCNKPRITCFAPMLTWKINATMYKIFSTSTHYVAKSCPQEEVLDQRALFHQWIFWRSQCGSCRTIDENQSNNVTSNSYFLLQGLVFV